MGNEMNDASALTNIHAGSHLDTLESGLLLVGWRHCHCSGLGTLDGGWMM